jgi:hypothetical protein
MTFVHQFSRRVRSTLVTRDEPPPEGETHILNCDWTQRPKPKHVREYVQWICEVNRQLADSWDKRMLHAIQVGPRTWELWQFEPRKAPVLGKVVRE